MATLHKYIYLTEDLFFVNSIPIFINLSRKICFATVNHLSNRKVETIWQGLQRDIHLFHEAWVPHHNSSWRLRIYPTKSYDLREHASKTQDQSHKCKEYVPDIEWQIRVVKSRTRAIRHRLPFNYTPTLLTIYIVFTVVRMMKYFLVKGGVSSILSTKTIMFGEILHYQCRLVI